MSIATRDEITRKRKGENLFDSNEARETREFNAILIRSVSFRLSTPFCDLHAEPRSVSERRMQLPPCHHNQPAPTQHMKTWKPIIIMGMFEA